MLRYFFIVMLIFTQPALSSLDSLGHDTLSHLYRFLSPKDVQNLSQVSKCFSKTETISPHLINLDFYYLPDRTLISPLIRSRVYRLNLLEMKAEKSQTVLELIDGFRNVRYVLLPSSIPAASAEILYTRKNIKASYPHLELLRLCNRANRLNLYPFLENVIYGSGFLTYISLNHLQSMKRIPDNNLALAMDVLYQLIPKDFQFKNDPTVILHSNNTLHAVSLLSVLLCELSKLNTHQLAARLSLLHQKSYHSKAHKWDKLLVYWNHLSDDLQP